MPIGSIISLILGLAALVAGAELLVQGASRLARLLGIPPVIIGLTIVAYGTSMPELVVSVNAALQGHAGIALGNVVGSNIFNVLGILGLSALVAPLVVDSRLVRIDVPVMVGVSALLVVMGLDGNIGSIDGAVLVGALILYSGATWVFQRRDRIQAPPEDEPESIRPKRTGVWLLGRSFGSIGLGLAILVLGAQQTVNGAVSLADRLGVSSLIIGLTVVAIGTSLPELATSVLASLRGQRDIAVGNIVGSNIFNILGVQGLASLVSWTGVAVEPSILRFDLPVMLAAAVACLPIFFTGYAIVRWEGALFLSYFLAYLTYLYLQAAQRQALVVFDIAMLAFVLPITVITLALVVSRELRRRRARR